VCGTKGTTPRSQETKEGKREPQISQATQIHSRLICVNPRNLRFQVLLSWRLGFVAFIKF